MNTTTHKITACIPVGPSDEGAEVELEITYTFLPGAPEQGPSYASGGQPADPDEIEFVSARNIHGEPYGAFADLEQDHLNDVARDWLDDKGFEEAVAHACEELEAAKEAAAEARAEMRREDR